MANRNPGGKKLTLVVLVAAALGFLIVALVVRERGAGPSAQKNAVASQPPASAQNPNAGQPSDAAQKAASQSDAGDGTPFSQIFGGSDVPAQPNQAASGDWLTLFATVTIRLTLAALLSALLAFRPRRFSIVSKRNPFVSQTQILLAVVASALMMIIGDSTARAFGIFATVSLVRFRTNIKDPKEITVLLLSLAIGLATGVGRWELGLILAFFSLLLLWGLEYREPETVTRAMELTVKTRNIGTTQDVLLNLFAKYKFDAEMRNIDRPDGDDSTGCIVYYVSVSQLVSTDRLSEEILAADPQNIDGVEWDQQKNTSYFYQ